MDKPPVLALIAHDSKKDALVAWAHENAATLSRFRFVATGTTGKRLHGAFPDWSIERVHSGPLGGDQQIGAMIAEGQVSGIIFFVDPLTPMPHDVDVKALTRLAVVYDIPMACSTTSADFILAGLAHQAFGTKPT